MKQTIEENIEVPQGVTVTVKDDDVAVKGPKGEVVRRMVALGVAISASGQKVSFKAKDATKREKKMLYTFLAHFKNMVRGVQEPWVYKLKVCSGHFPMTVSVSGKTFSIKNFLGEKVPRQCALPATAEVKVAGQEITVSSVDLESAGQAASVLELLTFKSKKDLRIFQDGIYITEKPEKKLK